MEVEPPGSHRPSWGIRRLLLLFVPLFLLWVYPIGVWPRFIGPNESVRAFLTLALYERGETAINKETQRYFKNEDMAQYQGRLYSNKSPGSSFWLLPAAALIDLLSPGRLELVPLLYFGRILMLTLPFLFFLYAVGRRLEEFLSPEAAWGLVLAYALGTNAGAYATLYFGHNLAAMAHGLAFFILWKRSRPWFWLAGFLAGFGVLTEISTITMAIVLWGLASFVEKHRFDLSAFRDFALGAFPIAMLFFLYNWASFDSPLSVANQFEVTERARRGYGSGLLGILVPDPEALYGLLFSPARGLFFHSPWLLLFFPAVYFVCRGSLGRHHYPLVASILIPLFQLLFISSYVFWLGGASVGPRYLTPALPFLLFPIAAYLGRTKMLDSKIWLYPILSLIVLSIAVHFILLASFPYVPRPEGDLGANPIATWALPVFQKGMGSFTVANFLGANLRISLAIFVLLLLAVLAGYTFPLTLKGKGNLSSPWILGAVVTGVLLVILWTRIGTSDNVPRIKQRDFFMKYPFHDSQRGPHGKVSLITSRDRIEKARP